MSYLPGERVRVSERAHRGHHRTPGYLKGKTGVVERIQGSFRNPESLAYGGDGLPERPLYTVSFSHRELWPAYDGRESDRVEADLYEQWLEKPA
jgi:nitrile hydratase subunit beta